MPLHNKYDKGTLRKKIEKESFSRTTLSFYRYVVLEDPEALRNELFEEWGSLGVLGRIYLAKEGINAQLNVPEPNLHSFIKNLNSREVFANMPLKKAIEDDPFSFLKLTIKVKEQIVADGLSVEDYDVTNVGKHLNANEFNTAMKEPDTLVVDMRNHYESEVGHFEGAILPEAETFKEELPMVLNKLKGKEDKKVLMYCTGGIRCEKASAYLKHHGFEDVNQLFGGIIHYKKQVEQQQLESKFIGKNFVFDERLGERITDDVIAKCHQCGEPFDEHTNCGNVACNLLFIQCEDCAEKYANCCTPKCAAINALPQKEQKEMRKGKEEKKRFNKGLQNPDELKNNIREQEENGFSIP